MVVPTITHAFVNTKGDSADSSITRPSDWNANHVITGLVDALGYTVGMSNGTFVLSAGSGALTIALKTLAGADPSVGDPVYVIFRNVTGTSGDFTTLAITSAQSMVVSSGSTLGVTTSTAFRLWIVGFNDAGTFRLGVGNFATATAIFPLVEGLATSTTEGGAGAADSAGVIYTGTGATAKAMRILGYAEWGASGLTAGTWTTTNLLSVQLMGPGVRKPGDVVQTSYVENSATTTTTSSTPQSTGLSLSFTQTSAANRVRATASGTGTCTNGSATAVRTQLYRDSTAFGTVTSHFANGISSQAPATMLGLDRSNLTAAATYQVRVWSSDNTTSVSWNSITTVTSLIVDEIMT